MVTGPKSANRSIRNSRSMKSGPRARRPTFIAPPSLRAKRSNPGCRFGGSLDCFVAPLLAMTSGLPVDLGRAQLNRLAAAAGGDLVGVVEDELGLHLVGL